MQSRIHGLIIQFQLEYIVLAHFRLREMTTVHAYIEQCMTLCPLWVPDGVAFGVESSLVGARVGGMGTGTKPIHTVWPIGKMNFSIELKSVVISIYIFIAFAIYIYLLLK